MIVKRIGETIQFCYLLSWKSRLQFNSALNGHQCLLELPYTMCTLFILPDLSLTSLSLIALSILPSLSLSSHQPLIELDMPSFSN